jgi:hypothetical protein
MVWEVLESHKIKWEAMGFVLGEWKEFKKKLKIISRSFQVEGGVTLLRGCKFWNEGRIGG